MKETRITAYISEQTKKELDRIVRSRGLKKGDVIEQALRHHLQALKEIPEEFIIPPVLVLRDESFEKLLRQIKSSPKPTPELRKLMRGEPVSEEGLY